MDGLRMHAAESFLLLSGQPPVRDFINFIKTRAVEGHKSDEFVLAQQWLAANGVLRSVPMDPNSFEVCDLEPLPPAFEARAQRALEAFSKYHPFLLVPHRWALVELDRLIVLQKHVNVDFSHELRKTLHASPSMEDLLNVAIGAQREPPPTRIVTHSSTSFSFVSQSTDLRVLAARPIEPAYAQTYEIPGHVTAVVALYVGYGTNVMYAIQMGKRLMLFNGTHRAYALRAHGVTHVPCLIGHASNQDDLDLVGLREHAESSRACWSNSRPPLLRDYFDERLCKAVTVQRSQKAIDLELKLTKSSAPMG